MPAVVELRTVPPAMCAGWTDQELADRVEALVAAREAAKSKWRRIEALRRVKSLVGEHAAALRTWSAGDRMIVFPAGTYAMRVLHGAQVARLAADASP